MLTIYHCQYCGFYTYDLAGKSHEWFYAPALGSFPEGALEVVCPTCKGAAHESGGEEVSGVRLVSLPESPGPDKEREEG